MLEFEELLRDLFWHADMDVLSCIVPFKTNTTVQTVISVVGDGVTFFNCAHEMIGMFASYVLDSKIVHN